MWSQREKSLLVSDMHCRKPCVSTPQIGPPAAAAGAPTCAGAWADEPPPPMPPNIMWPIDEPIIEPAAVDAIVPMKLGAPEAAAGGSADDEVAGGGAAGLGAITGRGAIDAGAIERGGPAMVDAGRDGAADLFLEREKPMLLCGREGEGRARGGRGQKRGALRPGSWGARASSRESADRVRRVGRSGCLELAFFLFLISFDSLKPPS